MPRARRRAPASWLVRCWRTWPCEPGHMLSLAQPPCDAGVLRGAAETPGCSSHAKKWVLVATILGSSVAFLEASVINVALPAIQDGLDASTVQMQWIASVYTLFL